MAFTKEASRVPTSIGDIYTSLGDLDGVPNTARAVIEVKDQAGDVMRVLDVGDLVSQLPPAIITMGVDFMVALRAQAESQILP